jgi:hypothetical protein
MRTQPSTVSEHLDVLIAHQQELAAKLAKSGKKQKARAARSKLMVLLNQRELSQSLSISDQAMDGGVQHQPQPQID